MNHLQQQISDIMSLVENDMLKERIHLFLSKEVETFSNQLVELDRGIESNEVSLEIGVKKLFLLVDGIMKQAEAIEEIITQKVILKKIKGIFREILKDGPAYKSVIVKRAHDKPRGYPGDYETLELVYENKTISEGIGFCIDKYMLNDDYIIAVRNRKDMMKEILSNYVKKVNSQLLNILNVGCGSCREIRELFQHGFNTDKDLIFNFIDQDEEALNFCRGKIKGIPGKFIFMKEGIVNLPRHEKYKKILNGQDMIYSIGVADYLPDMVLAALIEFCFGLLNPKGKIIIAHKNITEYRASAPDWFCDWHFFPRNKEKLAGIIKKHGEINNYKIECIEEKSKRIFFMVINKI
jgi:hypothetical protein